MSGDSGNLTLNSESGGNWFDNFFKDLGEGFAFIPKKAGEGYKELSGAKAAEDANEMAKKQFEETKAAAEQARADAITMTGKDQLAQSQKAGAARSVSASSRSANKGAPIISTSLLGSDEKDFLGL